MQFSVRPYLMAGVGVIAAGTIAIPASVAPPSPAPRHDSVALTAQTQPVNPLLKQPLPQLETAQAAAALLPAEAFASTEALTETLDVASAQVGALALPGLESAIITAYDVIMPWVDWGVNLGIYATQWIPVVNWFTPQISIFYYSLIRPIITSAVFNIAYWVGGTVSFGQGLSNFFNDTVNAGIGFVNAEIDWVLSFLPPFPPFPPFFSSVAASTVMEVVGARTALEIPAEAGTALTDAGEVPAGEDPQTPVTEPVEEQEPSTPETEAAEPPTEVEAEPETPVDAPEVELEGDLGTPAPEVDPTDDELVDELESEDTTADDLKDEDLKDTEKDLKADPKPEADAEKDSDVKKPDVKKSDTAKSDNAKSDNDKPNTKSGSGSDD